jgi:hypothetical protein
VAKIQLPVVSEKFPHTLSFRAGFIGEESPVPVQCRRVIGENRFLLVVTLLVGMTSKKRVLENCEKASLVIRVDISTRARQTTDSPLLGLPVASW